jgi:rhamnosyltransferase
MVHASIVIPTRNAGQGFRRTLDAVFSQRAPFDFEVRVVDSGSTDGTQGICQDYPVRWHSIPPEEFSHGGTRNRAIRQSSAPFVVLTVQDAVPADDRWLAALLEPLASDARLAGAYSRQVARPDAPYVVSRQLELWHASQARRVIRRIEDKESFERLPFDDKRVLCAFDNVSAAVRRAVWEDIPLPAVPFGEDIGWSVAVLSAGYAIAYVPESKIIHSHSRGFSYAVSRAYVDRKMLHAFLGGGSDQPKRRGRHLAFLRVVLRYMHDARRDGALTVRSILQGWSYYGSGFLGVWLAESYLAGATRRRCRRMRNRLDRLLIANLGLRVGCQ